VKKLPNTFSLPASKVFVHRLPSWEIFRQVTPNTAVVDLIEDGIEDFSLIDLAFATSTVHNWGQQGSNNLPFLLTEIAAVTFGSTFEPTTTKAARLESSHH
jgi:hypothetical protein